MKIIPLTGANYFEYMHFSLKQSEDDVVVIESTSASLFNQMLQRVSKAFGGKSTEKCYRQFIVGDLYHQIVPESGETTVYSLKPIVMTELEKNLLEIQYEKKKLSIINFPSTQNHHDVSDVKRVTFRFNNRVFLNFETRTSCRDSSAVTYMVYVNYNHEPNVDIETMTRDIKKAYAHVLSRE